MLEPLKLSKYYAPSVVDFIRTNQHLYFTKDNKRVAVKDLETLTKLTKECSFSVMKAEGAIISGLLFVWVSKNFDSKRQYVKFVYNTPKDLEDLIVYLNWHVAGEIYCKISKTSGAIKVLRTKGFHICADRNKEMLLFRAKNTRKFYAPIKEEDKLDE